MSTVLRGPPSDGTTQRVDHVELVPVPLGQHHPVSVASLVLPNAMGLWTECDMLWVQHLE